MQRHPQQIMSIVLCVVVLILAYRMTRFAGHSSAIQWQYDRLTFVRATLDIRNLTTSNRVTDVFLKPENSPEMPGDRGTSPLIILSTNTDDTISMVWVGLGPRWRGTITSPTAGHAQVSIQQNQTNVVILMN
jgi:hypothetical protein